MQHSLASMAKIPKFALFSSLKKFWVTICHTCRCRGTQKSYQGVRTCLFWIHTKFGEDSSSGLVTRSMHTKSIWKSILFYILEIYFEPIFCQFVSWDFPEIFRVTTYGFEDSVPEVCANKIFTLSIYPKMTYASCIFKL